MARMRISLLCIAGLLVVCSAQLRRDYGRNVNRRISSATKTSRSLYPAEDDYSEAEEYSLSEPTHELLADEDESAGYASSRKSVRPQPLNYRSAKDRVHQSQQPRPRASIEKLSQPKDEYDQIPEPQTAGRNPLKEHVITVIYRNAPSANSQESTRSTDSKQRQRKPHYKKSPKGTKIYPPPSVVNFAETQLEVNYDYSGDPSFSKHSRLSGKELSSQSSNGQFNSKPADNLQNSQRDTHDSSFSEGNQRQLGTSKIRSHFSYDVITSSGENSGSIPRETQSFRSSDGPAVPHSSKLQSSDSSDTQKDRKRKPIRKKPDRNHGEKTSYSSQSFRSFPHQPPRPVPQKESFYSVFHSQNVKSGHQVHAPRRRPENHQNLRRPSFRALEPFSDSTPNTLFVQQQTNTNFRNQQNFQDTLSPPPTSQSFVQHVAPQETNIRPTPTSHVFVPSAIEEPAHQSTNEEVDYDDSSSVNIPGEPGKDYPILSEIPLTGFSCQNQPPGFYADPDAYCQVWHYCDLDGRKESFLCGNGTLYRQEARVCDWWFNVDCTKSVNFYAINDDLYKIPPKKIVPEETPKRFPNSNGIAVQSFDSTNKQRARNFPERRQETYFQYERENR